MDRGTAVLLGVVGLMALDQLVLRIGALKARAALFWSIQALNVVVGTAILWWGLPGMERWPSVGMMVGLLFFFHTVQNTNARARWLRSRRDQAHERQLRAIRRALNEDGGEE